MGTKLNLFSKSQITANPKYLKKYSNIAWGPGHIKRDKFGILLPIKKIKVSIIQEKEDPHHAHIPK
jgi:hypothetical protein